MDTTADTSGSTSSDPETGSTSESTGPQESTGPDESSSSEASTEPDESSSTGVPAVCGNEILEDGEECDAGDLNDDTAQCTSACVLASCGDGLIQAGVDECDDGAANADDAACTSSCTTATCGDGLVQALVEQCDDGAANADDAACTSSCATAFCGDGFVLAGVETCDGALVGVACSDEGFDDGVIACDANDCVADTSGCFSIEFLQNDDGDCNANSVGCTDGTGTAGNPQDAVECFIPSLASPFEVVEVEYSIDGVIPLPSSADLVVYEWAGPGNLPGMLIEAVPLDPLTDIVVGVNTLVLADPVTSVAAGLCVGLRGTDPADGFRLDFTDADGPSGASHLVAPLCGINSFTEMTSLGLEGNFCIRPTITSPNPG